MLYIAIVYDISLFDLRVRDTARVQGIRRIQWGYRGYGDSSIRFFPLDRTVPACAEILLVSSWSIRRVFSRNFPKHFETTSLWISGLQCNQLNLLGEEISFLSIGYIPRWKSRRKCLQNKFWRFFEKTRLTGQKLSNWISAHTNSAQSNHFINEKHRPLGSSGQKLFEKQQSWYCWNN